MEKHYLTKACRLILLKSTPASLLVLMLSLFVIPCFIVEYLKRILKNCLWGLTLEKIKFHLLHWDQICTSMGCGGLGIKQLRYVNISFLCKCLWELGDGKDKLRKRVIFDNYGREQGDWSTMKSSRPCGCGFSEGGTIMEIFLC